MLGRGRASSLPRISFSGHVPLYHCTTVLSRTTVSGQLSPTQRTNGRLCLMHSAPDGPCTKHGGVAVTGVVPCAPGQGFQMAHTVCALHPPRNCSQGLCCRCRPHAQHINFVPAPTYLHNVYKVDVAVADLTHTPRAAAVAGADHLSRVEQDLNRHRHSSG